MIALHQTVCLSSSTHVCSWTCIFQQGCSSFYITLSLCPPPPWHIHHLLYTPPHYPPTDLYIRTMLFRFWHPKQMLCRPALLWLHTWSRSVQCAHKRQHLQIAHEAHQTISSDVSQIYYCLPKGYSFQLAVRDLLCAQSNIQDNTYHNIC